MTWEPSDRWRDSYDAWKLATPPEYETSGEPPLSPAEQDQRDLDDYLDQMQQQGIAIGKGLSGLWAAMRTGMPTGFGDTPHEAVADLLQREARK